MSIIRAQTKIEHASGIAENFVTNTMYYDMDAADAVSGSAAVLALVQAIKDFYAVAHTVSGGVGGTSLKSHFSTELSIGANHIFYTKLYDMSDPIPRTPIHDERWASAVSGAGVGMPSEVALCLSFQANVASGLNRARRRGRIYLGPLKSASAALGAQNVVRPTTALIEAGVGAMVAHKNDVDAIAGIGVAWGVYSQSNASLSYVSNGWVDDAFDTQRKRGADATAKTLW